MSLTSDQKALIQRIATKYNLPLRKIEEIVMSQFKFSAEKIASGEFKAIRLAYLGKFSANPKRLEHLSAKRKKKEEENEESGSSGE
jgi:nucleoid DNA-binding protein